MSLAGYSGEEGRSTRNRKSLHLPAGISIDAIRAQVEKILASRLFAQSKRLTRFLRFTVEQAIQGQADDLKEYLLGVEVFDRDPSFDPRIDSIVRVEAGRLRSRLKTYYETEGQDDPLLVQICKGSYVPAFVTLKTAGPRDRPSVSSSPHRKSIAVLNFKDLSPNKDQEYFCDGMTEELINALTSVAGLRVVAPTSVFQFKGKPQDVRRLGKQLNVNTLLEGSVRKSRDRLRITAQLVHTASGYNLWSEIYERRMKDVFAIQEEISRSIVHALRLQLVDEPDASLVGRTRENRKAYHFYLKGRYHWKKLTEEGLQKAIDCFDQAIAEDGKYAKAYAGSAYAHSLAGFYGGLNPNVLMAKAKEAAVTAVRLDDTQPEAHAALGLIRFLYDWDWLEAERELNRARELNPSYTTVRNWYGLFLACMGRMDDALTELKRAHELDPVSLITNTEAGWIQYVRRQYDEAIDQYLRTLELDPNFYLVYRGLGLAYEAKFMFDKAITAFEKSRALSQGMRRGVGALGHCLALRGKRAESQQLLKELRELSRRRYISQCEAAVIYVGLGDNERAMKWLEAARAEGDPWLVHLKVDPRFDGLRSEPRFIDLLEEVGLQH
jgi:TolB-like protein/tetratricopeptide (TPR) repeat protein